MSDTTTTADTATTPPDRADLEAFCEAIVPGCVEVGALRYLDALADELGPQGRVPFEAAIATVEGFMRDGRPLAEVVDDPSFRRMRAAVIEAHYSGYRQPGFEGPSAWETTGFADSTAAHMAPRDFTFLKLTVAP